MGFAFLDMQGLVHPKSPVDVRSVLLSVYFEEGFETVLTVTGV